MDMGVKGTAGARLPGASTPVGVGADTVSGPGRGATVDTPDRKYGYGANHPNYVQKYNTNNASSSSKAPSAASPILTTSILDTSLTQVRGEVNVDAYLALFSEMVSYCRDRVESVMGLQEKLSQLGYHIGRRALDLIVGRERISRRETRVLSILNFIVVRLWTFLYGKQADSLKKVRDSDCEYYIEENHPLVNKYISVPSDYGHFNCASFTAGIINGVLNASGFPAQVTAKILATNSTNTDQPHLSANSSSSYTLSSPSPMTIYYIKFDRSVLEREQKLQQ